MAKHKTHYEECDVLVVGGGMAGTGATFEARHWGRDLKIVCVEKANIDRSGAVAQGLYAINCYMGMQWDENQPEDHVRYARNDLMGLVREDLGYIPLVTPTSQIVGTQSVINVLNGERYKSITKETRGVLAGEYGATPAPVNKELQEKALDGAAAITCRPADLINDSFDDLVEEFKKVIKDNSLDIEANEDNTLIYALFPEIGLNYFKHLNDPEFFEQRPLDIHQQSSSSYLVTIDEKEFSVTIDENNNFDIAKGSASNISPNQPQQVKPQASSVSSQLNAPLGGNIFKILIAEGQTVSKDQTLIILEAMKMETEIKSPANGVISNIHIQVGDAVAPGDLLIDIA
mgnify:CR=1 FL=1